METRDLGNFKTTKDNLHESLKIGSKMLSIFEKLESAGHDPMYGMESYITARFAFNTFMQEIVMITTEKYSREEEK